MWGVGHKQQKVPTCRAATTNSSPLVSGFAVAAVAGHLSASSIRLSAALANVAAFAAGPVSVGGRVVGVPKVADAAFLSDGADENLQQFQASSKWQ